MGGQTGSQVGSQLSSRKSYKVIIFVHINMACVDLSGQTVKNVVRVPFVRKRTFTNEYELDQSQRKSTQVGGQTKRKLYASPKLALTCEGLADVTTNAGKQIKIKTTTKTDTDTDTDTGTGTDTGIGIGTDRHRHRHRGTDTEVQTQRQRHKYKPKPEHKPKHEYNYMNVGKNDKN